MREMTVKTFKGLVGSHKRKSFVVSLNEKGPFQGILEFRKNDGIVLTDETHLGEDVCIHPKKKLRKDINKKKGRIHA